MIITKLNKSDYLVLTIYFVVFIFVEVYDQTFYFNKIEYTFIKPDGTSYSQVNISPPLLGYLIGVPTSFFTTLSIVFIFYLWLIPKYLIERKRYLIFSILGLFTLVLIGILRYTTWHWVDNAPWQTYPNALDLIMKSLSNSASNAGLPLGILLTKKYFEAEVQIARVQKKQKESELKLLQAQINPHFLFNNLNTLDALIGTRPTEAKNYIARLSALYRYLINTKDKEVVLLEEELSMIKNYFYLIETRFGDVYTFSIKGSDNTMSRYLPVGALQVLIENVVKHNKVLKDQCINTVIFIESEQVVITNNKTGVSRKTESFGTGLDNLQERYALLFDKEIKVVNGEFEFQVSIPLIELTQ